MSMESISNIAYAHVEDCRGRGRAGKIDGCLKKKGRRKGRKEGGDARDFSLVGTMVQSRIDTQQTCGGAMQSSLKRVRDGQGSK